MTLKTSYRCFQWADETKIKKEISSKWLRQGARKKQRHIGGDVRSTDDPLAEHWSRTVFSETRYSDGSYNVLYTAESEETAMREVASYVYRQYAGGIATLPMPETKSFGTFEVVITGDERNLMDEFPDDPMLVHPSNYKHCQGLAKASKENFSYFVAPSARDLNGICYPVFTKDAVLTVGVPLQYELKLNRSSNTYFTDIQGAIFEIDIHDVYEEVNGIVN